MTATFLKRVVRVAKAAPRALPSLCALALLLVAPAVWAWNGTGHRLAAILAWERMSPPARAEAQRLLRAHPAALEWRGKLGSDDEVLLFAEASAWPDELRRRSEDSAWVGRGDSAAGDDWHYLNWPLGEPRGATRKGQLDRRITLSSLTIADTARPDRERAEALAWLLHLVADAHQPLHVATRSVAAVGQRNEDDAGGNGFEVLNLADRRRPQTNLHRFWDDLPGSSRLRGKRLRSAATAVAGKHPAAGAMIGDVDLWLTESHRLATTFAYPPGEPPFVIDDAYRVRARAAADERIALAGARLGVWLDRLLAR